MIGSGSDSSTGIVFIGSWRGKVITSTDSESVSTFISKGTDSITDSASGSRTCSTLNSGSDSGTDSSSDIKTFSTLLSSYSVSSAGQNCGIEGDSNSNSLSKTGETSDSCTRLSSDSGSVFSRTNSDCPVSSSTSGSGTDSDSGCSSGVSATRKSVLQTLAIPGEPWRSTYVSGEESGRTTSLLRTLRSSTSMVAAPPCGRAAFWK